jgi:hypothetical protein
MEIYVLFMFLARTLLELGEREIMLTEPILTNSGYSKTEGKS